MCFNSSKLYPTQFSTYVHPCESKQCKMDNNIFLMITPSSLLWKSDLSFTGPDILWAQPVVSCSSLVKIYNQWEGLSGEIVLLIWSESAIKCCKFVVLRGQV